MAFFAALALVPTAIAAVGCGGPVSSQKAAGQPAAAEVHVDLDEWTIKPDRGVVDAGDDRQVMLTFDGHNHGGIPHELIILKTDLDPEKLPATRGKVDVAAVGQQVGEIVVDELPPGATVSHVFDLEAGRYVLICNIAGHYSQGMRAALVVT